MHLEAVVLENCWYSKELITLLNKNNININYISVSQSDKHKYKTNDLTTFPQVYLINDTKRILIGGYDDISKIINIINTRDYKYITQNISSKYNMLSKNTQLRLIKFFIKKKYKS